MKIPKRALFIGRFQPFHHGHYKAVKMLLKEYEELIIVLGSAESPPTFENPFSAGERIEMITSCFSVSDRAKIHLIPVRDINDHSRWVSHICAYIPSFDCVYSNNQLVNTLFLDNGFKVKEMGFFNRDRYEGKKIREAIATGKSEWKKYVPKSVVFFVEKYTMVDRLRRSSNGLI